ncbi:MAG: NADH-quinone oxidoreductase subunit N [Chloroflexota bacterium]
MTQLDFYTILPVSMLIIFACLLLLVDLWIPAGKKGITALLTAFALALTMGISLTQLGNDLVGFNGMVSLDGFSIFMNVLFCLIGLFGVAVAYGYLRRMNIEKGEYYIIMLFSISGMMLMSQATDLIITFLALELLSIPLYVLAAFAQVRTESEEAGIKYFLLGAYATGFVVYGIALTFGAAGTTSFSGIVAAISAGTYSQPLLLVGAALILIGFSFKVGAVPFHMWTPDVYQGAPTSVTAFMAAGAKAAGFAALFRVFSSVFPSLAVDLMPVMAVLAALSMIVGNFLAIAQTDIKRMLAYSSIAQAGYIMMAFVPFVDPAIRVLSVSAGLFYLVAYTITNFGSWGVVIALEKAEGKGLSISDYAGLGKKYPMLAAAMAIFMLSLTGLPPTLGLVGKFYLFRTIMQGGVYWLALVGVITSLVSAYYYLRIIVIMYMKDGNPQITREFWLEFAIGASAVLTVLFSFVPQPLFDWASQAVLKIF